MSAAQLILAMHAGRGTAGVFGTPSDELPVTPVQDPALARLVALGAARRVMRPAFVHTGGAFVAVTPDGVHIDVDADAAPAEAKADPTVAAALSGAARPLVVAGQGVVTADTAWALRTVAALARCGVLNTWGSKGVLPWDSPYHLGTFGIQAGDVALAALDGYDVVVTTGLGVAERALLPGRLPVLDVDAHALPGLAASLTARTTGEATTGSPLRDALSAVVQAAWGAEDPPLPPTLITRQYSAALGARGLLAADAGVAGYFAARTFPTLRPGSVVLPPPGPPVDGFAAAAVLAARLRDPLLPALAVVSAPVSAATLEVCALARALGTPLPVAVWSPDGPALDASGHARGLARTARTSGVLEVGYDPAQLDELVAVAGPVTTWVTADVVSGWARPPSSPAPPARDGR